MRRFMTLFFPGILIFSLLLAVLVLTVRAVEDVPAETEDSSVLSVSAECAILIDAATGAVLYEKNAEQQHLIASTTKIMTALVVLNEAEDLDATVTIPDDWAGVEGSSMYLKAGDVVSIRALLYGLLLNSGNDAATVLAIAVAGDEASFVEQMNEYAAELGMEDTHFANPHGLDAEGHYSTAHDMARLMVEAMKDEDFREISRTRYISIDGFELYFHNKLLDLYEYCISGKTGYTTAAGRTLVTASEKDGQLLIAVTLNDPDDWNDQIAMYEYGFSSYSTETLCTKGECYTTVTLAGSDMAVPVYCSDTLTMLVSSGEETDVREIVCLPEELTTSVMAGAMLGELIFQVDGQEVGSTWLIAGAYADAESKEVSYEWKSEFKNSFRLAGSYPDAQPNGTYRTEGLLSTAFWHDWG